MGRFWNFFGKNYLKFNLSRGHFLQKNEISLNRDHWMGAVLMENSCLSNGPKWANVEFFWPNLPQSYRVTDTQLGTQYTGGWNFFCLISINSPTRFARRGISSECKPFVNFGIFTNQSLMYFKTFGHYFIHIGSNIFFPFKVVQYIIYMFLLSKTLKSF